MKKSFMGLVPLLFLMGLAAVGVAIFPNNGKADSFLAVDINGARNVSLQGSASDVVVGNPGIADVSLQAPDHLVVIGKLPGRTRVIAMDASQKILFDQVIVVVAGDAGMVTVTGPRKGTLVQNDYACGAHCSPINAKDAIVGTNANPGQPLTP